MTPPLVGRRLTAFGDDYADKKEKGEIDLSGYRGQVVEQAGNLFLEVLAVHYDIY